MISSWWGGIGRHRHPGAAPRAAAAPCRGAVGVRVGRAGHRQEFPGPGVRRLPGPGVRDAAGHPARARRPHRRARAARRSQPVRPTGVDRPRRALLPVPRRAELVGARGPEGVLLADPRPPGGRLRAAAGLDRDRCRQPGQRQRPGPPDGLGAGQPAGPRAPAGQRGGLAGLGARRRRAPPWVVDYLTQRPDHLWSRPPKTEEAFSTPRSWHMLSDALRSWGDEIGEETLRVLACGTLTATHASAFCAYVKTVQI